MKNLPHDELKKLGHINERGIKADDDPENARATNTFRAVRASPPSPYFLPPPSPRRRTHDDTPTSRCGFVPRTPAQYDETLGESGMIAAGPAVRRFAREVGVNLAQVSGTGPGGRITRDDVLAAVRQASAGSDAAKEQETDGFGPIRREKMSRIRKTIASKMHESWSTVPRVTNFDDADVTDLEAFRQSSKADYAEKGIKLTSMPFLIKAIAMALKEHPLVNASLDTENEQIIYKEYVNIGIAVDGERGLVVPSLRGVDDLAIPEIARDFMDLINKVRNNEFSMHDLKGSTFTISNLGAIGGTYSTPIVNVPEVAILLVGRSRELPVVKDDQIVARLMMPMSLSYDHRLVDGATAARFLNDVIGYLEAPGRLLLAP